MVQLNLLTSHLSNFVSFLKNNFDHICVHITVLICFVQKAAKTALGELSIQYWPTQIDKVIQLNSTLQVRHGVMLVGPAGGGKTTTRQILKRALVVLPTIQAREQQRQHIGTGEEPDENGSSKTALSYLVILWVLCKKLSPFLSLYFG